MNTSKAKKVVSPFDGDLPEGWTHCALDKAGRWGTGGTPSRRVPTYFGGEIPWVKSGDLKDGKIAKTDETISREGLEHSAAKVQPPGTVIIALYGATIGKLGILGIEAATNQACANCRVDESIALKEFVFYFLLQQRAKLISAGQGGAQPNLTNQIVRDWPVCLPPLAEQTRIVEKVEQLLAHVNTGRERLFRVPAILKRLRQAVLAAACSGRLTADWREEKLEKLAKPTELLEAIRAERSRSNSSAQSKTYRVRNTMQPNSDFEPEVPEGWAVASMDELAIRVTSGSRDWKRYYRDDGPGTFIMAQNVRPLVFDRSYRLAVDPPSDDRDRKRSEVKQGDILVTIVGANTGDVCRVRESVKQHYVCQSVALIRPAMPEMSAYLELYLNSPVHGQAQYRNWIYGEGRPHLSFDHLRETAVLLPPVEEQREIVRRVGALFKLADAIEKRVAAATARADKLTQAFLAKAFRGELVLTEAELARREGRTYEPASVLLARSRATSAASSNNGALPKRGKRRANDFAA